MDDEEMIRDMAAYMLREMGYAPTCAASGEGAIALYRQAKEEGNPFAAVILDLTVPGGMGGRETAEHLLAEAPEAKLIVSSGYSNDPIMADYLTYGFRNAVVKPYRMKDLAVCLQRVLTGEAHSAPDE